MKKILVVVCMVICLLCFAIGSSMAVDSKWQGVVDQRYSTNLAPDGQVFSQWKAIIQEEYKFELKTIEFRAIVINEEQCPNEPTYRHIFVGLTMFFRCMDENGIKKSIIIDRINFLEGDATTLTILGGQPMQENIRVVDGWNGQDI